MFKKHFPKKMNDHNSYDVFMVCWGCHGNYEIHANHLKRSQLNWKPTSNKGCLVGEELSILKTLNAILNHGHSMPHEVIERKMQLIRDYYGENNSFDVEDLQNKTQDILDKLRASQQKNNNFDEKAIAKFVNSLEDINNFIIMWRKHFVEAMKPKFLPKEWDIEYRF